MSSTRSIFAIWAGVSLLPAVLVGTGMVTVGSADIPTALLTGFGIICALLALQPHVPKEPKA